MCSLDCDVFAELLERRFLSMARAEEQRIVPDARRVKGWTDAAALVAETQRDESIGAFCQSLMTAMRGRGRDCTCGRPEARDDHESTCNRYIWSRADWVVQQELAESAAAGD